MKLEDPNMPLGGAGQFMKGKRDVGGHVCDLGILNGEHKCGSKGARLVSQSSQS